MIKLTTNALGTFALKNGRIAEKILFPRDAKGVASRLIEAESSFCDEEKKLVLSLKKTGAKEILVNKPERFAKLKAKIEFKKDEKEENIFSMNEQFGFQKEDLTKFLREVQIEITKGKLKESSWDRVLIQCVNTLDDLEDISNVLMEHLREWYSLKFPELERVVREPKLYASAICNADKLEDSLKTKIAAEKIKSFGMEFSEEDEQIVQKFANNYIELLNTKEEMETYVQKVMEKNAPNMNALVGPLLGAKLISIAGSLKKLALMPSSTIQILGAENAFFKFLKTKKKPPKHGVIFQLPEIRSASKKARGRLSRTLAAKLSIAARCDYYKGSFIGEKLREDFIKRVTALKK